MLFFCHLSHKQKKKKGHKNYCFCFNKMLLIAFPKNIGNEMN